MKHRITPARLAGRLRRSVSQVGDCLIWIGARDRDGYGRPSISNVRVLAHRLSWWLAHGEIPLGLHVLHRCDQPSCVHIEHLFLGTHEENIRDRENKGRGRVPVRAKGRWTGRMKRSERGPAKKLILQTLGMADRLATPTGFENAVQTVTDTDSALSERKR